MRIFYSQPLTITLHDEALFRSNWNRISEGLDYLSNFFTNDFTDDSITLRLRRELQKELSKNRESPYTLIYQYDDHQKLITEAGYIPSPMDHLKLDMNLMASSDYVVLNGLWKREEESKVIYKIAKSRKIPILVAVKDRYGSARFHEAH